MKSILNFKNVVVLIFICISFSAFSQTKKHWILKVNSDVSEETKRVFDGKKVKEGTTRLDIDKSSYVDIIIKKGNIVNMIFVSSSDGITITTDMMKANNANPNINHCEMQRQLCQIQCRLGKIPDPTRSGSCLDQCELAFKVCPFIPSLGSFGGFVLH